MRSQRLPDAVRRELPQRVTAAAQLDHDHPTPDGSTVLPARALYRRPKPCTPAVVAAAAARDYLTAHHAADVTITADQRGYGDTGILTVWWSDGPTVRAVAEHLTDRRDPDGLPVLPGWITLRADHDFDMRWQQPY